MGAKEKLLELLDGINFQPVDGNESPEEFQAKLRQNNEQYDLMAAKCKGLEPQVLDLLAFVLAERLYPLAMEKHGNTAEPSLRSILAETELNPETTPANDKVKQLALEVLRTDGLDDSQLEMIGTLIDAVPGMVLSALVELAARLKMIPMTEYSRIAGTLAMMMKEVAYASDNRDYRIEETEESKT